MQRRAIAVVSLIGLIGLSACSSEPSSGEPTSASGSGTGGSGGTSGGGTSTGGGSPTTGGTTTGGVTDAGDTWTTWASPQFFQAFCVSCHNPTGAGNPSPGGKDFNLYQDVAANAGLIRCGVAVTQNADWNCSSAGIVPEQFPIGTGPKPSAEQRDRLVDWIDAGFPH